MDIFQWHNQNAATRLCKAAGGPKPDAADAIEVWRLLAVARCYSHRPEQKTTVESKRWRDWQEDEAPAKKSPADVVTWSVSSCITTPPGWKLALDYQSATSGFQVQTPNEPDALWTRNKRLS